MNRAVRMEILLVIASALGACGSDAQDSGEAGAGTAGTGEPAPGVKCATGEFLIDGSCVTPSADWTEIATGGETTCLRGDPYSFFVHPGTTDKLLIYFAFGGFCYDAELCAVGALNAVPEINVDPASLSTTSGIFDLTRDDNPFRDWSWIYVPECTADFEWGDAVVDYPAKNLSPAITVHHKGFVNATAVREWIYENFASPEKIVVAGSSGGADAGLMHYAYLREHYTDVKDWVLLADSSFGITTEAFLTDYMENWNAYANRPTWIPAIANVAPGDMNWDYVQIEGAKYYGSGVVAEYGTAYDTLQSITYGIMGGDKSEWHDKLEAHLDNVSSNLPSFRYLVTPGTGHIALNTPRFYQDGVDGVSLRDWVADIAEGRDVQSVACSDDCAVEPELPDPGPVSGTGGVTEQEISCLGALNCHPDEVCCMSLLSQSASCQPGGACPFAEAQLCETDAECASGVCSALTLLGVSFGTCGLGGTASTSP